MLPAMDYMRRAAPPIWGARLLIVLVTLLAGSAGYGQGLAPLPSLRKSADAKQVALGRLLFFDGRLSGDGSTSCSTCHDPGKGWADGLPLSIGYPGTLYFRNTPTVLNAVHGRLLYWDGRLPAADLPTLVRDHISEAHFMQADGRLIIERMRQIPGYEAGFREAFGGEPTYGRILNSIAAYLTTLRSSGVPFDRYLRGSTGALDSSARRGLGLFKGKAGCTRCHGGPMLSDGGSHSVGLGITPGIFAEPERHISFRRFFRTLGVSEYITLDTDVGRYALTKEDSDRGLFRTPTLREVSRTAPYMHDGSLATLEDVIEFYDRGGGTASNKDTELRPLGLSAQEKRDLVAFLESLSGADIEGTPADLPGWRTRTLGSN